MKKLPLASSMAWLLRFAGFDVKTVEGGYKNYRNFVLQQFDNQGFKAIVLGGKTGSGKTLILKELEKLGEQIIDLEAIAQHKGSAFGWIGESQQGSTEQFENDLYEICRKIDPNRRVWIENESRSVGAVFIPQGLWNMMKAAPLIHIEVPFDLRVQHLIEDYTGTSKEDLTLAFEKISKKLGHEALTKAKIAVEKGDFATAAAIGLKYYDKTYTHSFDTNIVTAKHILEVEGRDNEKTAKILIDFVDSNL